MELKEIIERTHRQWLVAKQLRTERCEIAGKPDVARKLEACDMFKGSENMAEITQLFASPQGLEFCLAANFPNLHTFRLFKPFEPAKYGFYIDAGNITLRNPGTAILIGRTSATVECDSCERHTIVAMHGASAVVAASGWAVVHTEAGISANIVRRTSGHAIIL